jgi:hypothetical protein
MIKKYVPKQCQGENPTFTGELELRVPTNIDLWEMFEELGLEIGGEEGKIVLAESSGKMKQMARMARATLPFYHSVNLVKVSDGTKLASVEDLLHDRDAQAVLAEVAGVIFSGMGPEKKSEP